jgi:hypothetical protein
MKRGKKGVGGAANFWPGYVDAMVNVVLNLLFMVALFGITLAVFSKQPKKGADGDTEAQTEAEAAALSPPDATLGWPAQDVPPTPLLRDPDNAGDPTNIRAPSAPVVSGPLGPTRLGDNMGRADTAVHRRTKARFRAAARRPPMGRVRGKPCGRADRPGRMRPISSWPTRLPARRGRPSP